MLRLKGRVGVEDFGGGHAAGDAADDGGDAGAQAADAGLAAEFTRDRR